MDGKPFENFCLNKELGQIMKKRKKVLSMILFLTVSTSLTLNTVIDSNNVVSSAYRATASNRQRTAGERNAVRTQARTPEAENPLEARYIPGPPIIGADMTALRENEPAELQQPWWLQPHIHTEPLPGKKWQGGLSDRRWWQDAPLADHPPAD
jgi:hypothetical protein